MINYENPYRIMEISEKLGMVDWNIPAMNVSQFMQWRAKEREKADEMLNILWDHRQGIFERKLPEWMYDRVFYAYSQAPMMLKKEKDEKKVEDEIIELWSYDEAEERGLLSTYFKKIDVLEFFENYESIENKKIIVRSPTLRSDYIRYLQSIPSDELIKKYIDYLRKNLSSSISSENLLGSYFQEHVNQVIDVIRAYEIKKAYFPGDGVGVGVIASLISKIEFISDDNSASCPILYDLGISYKRNAVNEEQGYITIVSNVYAYETLPRYEEAIYIYDYPPVNFRQDLKAPYSGCGHVFSSYLNVHEMTQFRWFSRSEGYLSKFFVVPLDYASYVYCELNNIPIYSSYRKTWAGKKDVRVLSQEYTKEKEKRSHGKIKGKEGYKKIRQKFESKVKHVSVNESMPDSYYLITKSEVSKLYNSRRHDIKNIDGDEVKVEDYEYEYMSDSKYMKRKTHPYTGPVWSEDYFEYQGMYIVRQVRGNAIAFLRLREGRIIRLIHLRSITPTWGIYTDRDVITRFDAIRQAEWVKTLSIEEARRFAEIQSKKKSKNYEEEDSGD